jgi:hypothetical protein
LSLGYLLSIMCWGKYWPVVLVWQWEMCSTFITVSSTFIKWYNRKQHSFVLLNNNFFHYLKTHVFTLFCVRWWCYYFNVFNYITTYFTSYILFYCSIKLYPCRVRWPCRPTRSLRPIDCWDRGFESRWGHLLLLCSLCVLYLAALATSWSVIYRSHTASVCVILCDLETSTVRRSMPDFGCCTT